MTIEKLDKANENQKSIAALRVLSRIMNTPYPKMHSNDNEICFINFDEETQKELKIVINSTIKKRIHELTTEFENL